MDNHTPEFDQYAQSYTKILDKTLSLTGEDSNFFAQYKAEKLASWLPQLVQRKSTILDFGCGVGLMASRVGQMFPHASLFGVDPSSKSVELAQQQFGSPRITFEAAEKNLNYPDNTFDMAYASNVFHHIPFEEHAGYVKEIFRVLKPGGVFVLIESNPLNPGTRYIFKHSPIETTSRMLYPWYARTLVQNFGAPKIKYYCFYPKFLGWLRFTEPALTKVPMGGFYAYLTPKKACA